MPIFCLFNWWKWKGKSSMNLVIVCKYSIFQVRGIYSQIENATRFSRNMRGGEFLHLSLFAKWKVTRKDFVISFLWIPYWSKKLKRFVSFELWFEIGMYKNTKITLYEVTDLQIVRFEDRRPDPQTKQVGRPICKPCLQTSVNLKRSRMDFKSYLKTF